MTRYQRERLKQRREAGRRGGIKSQQVQREKRMELHRGEPVYPARPRWSIGLRDNWSGEEAWIVFRSWRDIIRRVNVVRANLCP